MLDGPIVSHLIQKLETEKENLSFARVDADAIDKLIQKDEEIPSVLSEADEKSLKETIEGVLPKEKYTVQFESMSLHLLLYNNSIRVYASNERNECYRRWWNVRNEQYA